jgi:hypothetical protein
MTKIMVKNDYITCSKEVTNMQERSKKCAGITCNREFTNVHRKTRKTYCTSKKKKFRDDEKYFFSIH